MNWIITVGYDWLTCGGSLYNWGLRMVISWVYVQYMDWDVDYNWYLHILD